MEYYFVVAATVAMIVLSLVAGLLIVFAVVHAVSHADVPSACEGLTAAECGAAVLGDR